MKKMRYIVLLIILLIPVIVNAEDCDTSKIYIDSISMDKTNNIEELDPATANGKTIKINLGVSNVGDNIKYKIVLKNDSNEEYEFDKKSISTNSDYMNYSIESDDNSNIVKAKSTKVLYLNVQYKNEVPDSAYTDGTFSDNITMKVDLSTEESLLNPNTGIKYYIIISLIIIISSFFYLLLKNNKKSKVLLILCLILIPISAKALCKCQIQLESTVTIQKPRFTGVVYRASSTILGNGDYIDYKKIKCTNSTTECNYIDENEYNRKIVYIKHDIENNQIINTYICKDNICLKGGQYSNFDENKQLFFSIPNHAESDCNITEDSVTTINTHDYVNRTGAINLSQYCGSCHITAQGISSCQSLDMDAC